MKFKKLKEKMDVEFSPALAIRVVGEETKKFDTLKEIPDDYDEYQVEEISKDMTIILTEKKPKKKKKNKNDYMDGSEISEGIMKVEEAINRMKESDEE